MVVAGSSHLGDSNWAPLNANVAWSHLVGRQSRDACLFSSLLLQPFFGRFNQVTKTSEYTGHCSPFTLQPSKFTEREDDNGVQLVLIRPASRFDTETRNFSANFGKPECRIAKALAFDLQILFARQNASLRKFCLLRAA